MLAYILLPMFDGVMNPINFESINIGIDHDNEYEYDDWLHHDYDYNRIRILEW